MENENFIYSPTAKASLFTLSFKSNASAPKPCPRFSAYLSEKPGCCMECNTVVPLRFSDIITRGSSNFGEVQNSGVYVAVNHPSPVFLNKSSSPLDPTVDRGEK